ncbi:MAG: ATP synthase F1 subunit gamma [Clostridiales bacterium]|jgi:F-type H+-transporting ATPase subunit gamma|nr:ATP synthase F1 subunit gamma [Clostridiales bacterium]
MATMREIKGRIRSVTTTQKTTKAMNLVSSSKLARAKAKLIKSTPFFNQMRRVIGNIITTNEDFDHRYFEKREAKKSLIIVIANDRGLCGGYNNNICKLGAELGDSLMARGKQISYFCIGNKARDYFRRRGSDILNWQNGISENPFYEDAQEITGKILPLYLAGTVDEVHICYTEFVSAITYTPQSVKILPLYEADFYDAAQEGANLIKFEPSSYEVLDYVAPKLLAAITLEALSTSAAAGQAATMTAMDSATENAGNIIDNLNLVYNRARQAAITQEISEIVGGANALK